MKAKRKIRPVPAAKVPGGFRALGILLGSVFGVLGLSLLFNTELSFNLWDNFESFMPVSIYIHNLWLDGLLPLVNVHQNLGAPIAGNGFNGAFYFPYTLGLLILKLTGMPDQSLPSLMALFHFPLAVWGWWKLFREFKVTEEFAVAASAGVVSCGFYVLGSAIWQHVGPEYAWFPWILYFVTRLMREDKPLGPSLGFAFAWFMASVSSHVQQLLYIGLHTVVFSALMLRIEGRARWRRLMVPLAWMPLLGFLSVSYLSTIMSVTQRAEALSAEVFFEASLKPVQLLGLLSPILNSANPIFGTDSGFLFFAGIWVPLGLGLLLYKRVSLALPAVVCGLLFTDFALGDSSLIYRFTQSIPVWSNFRWPYKFSFHFISMFVFAAAISLSSVWPGLAKKNRQQIFSAVIAALWIIQWPRTGDAFLMLATQTGLALFLLWPMRSRLPGTIFFAVAYFACVLSWTASHSAHRYTEKYGDYPASRFNIDSGLKYRVIPLDVDTACPNNICTMQPQWTLDSATANGYLSLTGTVVGTLPGDFTQLVSRNVWGTLNPEHRKYSVASPLLRSLGTRYYVSFTNSNSERTQLLKSKGLTAIWSKDGLSLLEDANALPVASIPESVHIRTDKPFTTEFYSLAGDRSALVHGLPQPPAQKDTHIHGFDWIPGRGIDVDVENRSASGSLVLISLYPYPFLEALVDGVKVPFYKTNALATGVVVGPGRHKVIVRASANFLLIGVLLAVLGLAGGIFVIRRFVK